MTDEPHSAPAFDPYAAPTASVVDVGPAGQREPVFYPVGMLKLVLLSVACLGLYQLYWFYRNWKCVQRLTGAALNAPVRAFFYPVTAWFLFRRIDETQRAHGRPLAMYPGVLAGLLLACTLAWRLPDPYWLLGVLQFVPLLPVQRAVNALNATLAPQADPNRRWGLGSLLALLIGGSVLALAIIGTLAGESAPQ